MLNRGRIVKEGKTLGARAYAGLWRRQAGGSRIGLRAGWRKDVALDRIRV